MLQVIANGLLISGVYALVAVGLTMIYGVMKIVNFAQGEFLMMGMFVTFGISRLFSGEMNPYWLVLPVAFLMAIFGMIVFHLLIKPIIGRDDSNFIVLTFGLSYLLQNAMQFFFGSSFRSLSVPEDMKTGAVKLGMLILMKSRLIAFVIALVIVALIFWFLNKTDAGRAMRATAESTEISKTLGINTQRSYALAFAIGTVFAGFAGLLLTPLYYVYPRVGTLFANTAWTCIVLGGLGSINGALLGAVIIGLGEAFTSTYLDANLVPVMTNALLLIILIVRPTGILGRKARKA